MLTIVENTNFQVTYSTSLALNGTELLQMILNIVNSNSPLIKNETLNTAVFTKGSRCTVLCNYPDEQQPPLL